MRTFNHESLAIKISLVKDTFGGKVKIPLFLSAWPVLHIVSSPHCSEYNLSSSQESKKNQEVNINGFLSNQDKFQSLCKLKVMQLTPRKISQGLKWFFKGWIKNSKLDIAI